MTFHWSELLVILLGGLVLFLGLALLILRRRGEIMQELLTPEEPELEEEFFRVRKVQPEETPAEEDKEGADEAEGETKENTVQWGAASAD